jgi:hypothetical protein
MSNRWRSEMTAAWPAARALLKSAKRSIAQPDSFDKSFFSSSDGSLFSSLLFTGWANHKKKKKHFKAGASVSEASVSFS